MEGAFRGIGQAFGCMLVALLISVPLGLWKFIEIAVWVWSNLHWGPQ